MKQKWDLLQQWFQARSPREAWLIFAAGSAVIYLLWNLILEWPLHYQSENLRRQNEKSRAELDSQKQKLATLETLITSHAFVQELAEQKQLNAEARGLGAELRKIEDNFIPEKWLTHVTNDIIAQQEEVTLLSMKTFADEPWTALKNTPGNAYVLQGAYKHKMQIEFRGTYFNAIEFFSHLEKLPWHFYWDSLDYKVLTYPEADVVAQFYVLSI